MSQAFVKEPDDQITNKLPDWPQNEHPNYVTAAGRALLNDRIHAHQERRAALDAEADDPMRQQRIAEVERDLRYWQWRLERAVVIDVSTQPQDEVHFGAVVEVEDAGGGRHVFEIVGEDEADVIHNKVSWMSPLAKAMMGAKVGDTVTWQRPAGNLELEITAIRYQS